MNQVGNIGPIEYFSLNDQQRKKHGIPEVDKNIYSRENGWAIEALACLHEHCADEKALTMALNAAHYIILHHAWPDGGFKHTKNDAGAQDWQIPWQWVGPCCSCFGSHSRKNG